MKFSSSTLRNALALFGIGCVVVLTANDPTLSSLLPNLVLSAGFIAALTVSEGLLRACRPMTGAAILLGTAGGLLFGFLLSPLVKELGQTSLYEQSQAALSVLTYCFGIAFFSMAALRALEGILAGSDALTNAENEIATSLEKKVFIDEKVLSDRRFFEFAASGVLDNQLVLSHLVIKELQKEVQSEDENTQVEARHAIDCLTKLQALTHLNLITLDEEVPLGTDLFGQLITLAKKHNAHLLTSDPSLSQKHEDGVKIIHLNLIANALKPMTQTGEYIIIKIQRYGKEALQGVGYLDDGTMVVVNGGAGYIGESIKARVLSVKHTTSGRMIFCNALEEGAHPNGVHDHEGIPTHAGSASQKYFSV